MSLAEMHDLLIVRANVSGAAASPAGLVDIAIQAGSIVAIEPEIEPSRSREVVDAGGRRVLPGLIDTHVHFSGRFGRPVGYRMMLRAGVTSALDLAGNPTEVLNTAAEGCGMTVGTLFPIIPEETVNDRNPSRETLRVLMQKQLSCGALGFKVLGGHYPLTPDATARVFEVCSEFGAYCAIHVGTTETGSDVEGLAEAVRLAAGKRVHLAHINSYCRGQLNDPVLEAARAVSILEKANGAVSESYLSRINAAEATCRDGVPVSRVVTTCLRLGGYGNSQVELRRAIAEGWAMVHGEVNGEIGLLDASGGLALYDERSSAVAISFPVNPPAASLAVALARRHGSRDFVVDALSTDGGSLPRNTTLEQGLGLVAAKALTFSEFVLKASAAPAKMLGLGRKGGLAVGGDADLIVAGREANCEVSIINGIVVWTHQGGSGRGKPAVLCHPDGQDAVVNAGARPIPLVFGA